MTLCNASMFSSRPRCPANDVQGLNGNSPTRIITRIMVGDRNPNLKKWLAWRASGFIRGQTKQVESGKISLGRHEEAVLFLGGVQDHSVESRKVIASIHRKHPGSFRVLFLRPFQPVLIHPQNVDQFAFLTSFSVGFQSWKNSGPLSDTFGK